MEAVESSAARFSAALLLSVGLHVGAGLLPPGASPGGADTAQARLPVRLTAVANAASLREASVSDSAPPPGRSTTAPAAGGREEVPPADASAPRLRARYFLPGELTERARVEHMASLEPPEILGLLGEGMLRVEILLDAAGRVDGVRILQRSVPEVFLEHAVEVFRQASYRPGRILGRAVPSVMHIEISLAPLRPEFIKPIDRRAPSR